MDDRRFARGARIKPQPQERPPINEELPFHEFMAMVAIYAVRDYKIDRAMFMTYADCAFEAATRAHSATALQEGK